MPSEEYLKTFVPAFYMSDIDSIWVCASSREQANSVYYYMVYQSESNAQVKRTTPEENFIVKARRKQTKSHREAMLFNTMFFEIIRSPLRENFLSQEETSTPQGLVIVFEVTYSPNQ